MSLTPKPVIALASSGAITPNIPLLVDTNGVLFVSPPTFMVGGVEKTAGFIQVNADAQLATLFGAVSADFNYAFNGATWDRVVSDDSTGAPVNGVATGNLKVLALQYVWDPITAVYEQVFQAPINADAIDPALFTPAPLNISVLSAFNGATFDRVRVANVFKTVLATALGLTTVWTPTAGKSFRLMGYTISVAGTLAATGVELIKLVDNVVGNLISQHQATVTITTPTGDTQIGASLNNGFLSAAANNVLKVNLSAAMLTGGVVVNVWGTEE